MTKAKQEKLVVAYILENDEDVFKFSYESVYDYADKIIVIWSPGMLCMTPTMDKDRFLDQYGIDDEADKVVFIEKYYEHGYKGANGLQRNQYINHIKRHCIGDYCLVIDADEVLDLRMTTAKFIDKLRDTGIDVFNPRMRHVMYHLDKEDNERDIHHCQGRLFKVTGTEYYDEVEHPVLKLQKGKGKSDKDNQYPTGNVAGAITLWHFAYARELFRLKAKYINHKEKSNIHTPEYLHWWYLSHLFGKYPHTTYNLMELPQYVKDYFLITDIDDMTYFEKRKDLETKHFIECKQWMNHFGHKSVLYCGCGMGQRVYVAWYNGLVTQGFDISTYAINNSPFRDTIGKHIKEGDIRSYDSSMSYPLVVAYDVLEHLDKKDLDKALTTIKNHTHKHVLISVPVKGDGNLDNDPTHRIKETKDWWKRRISKHFKILPTPKDWLYKEQIIVGELKQ